MLLFALFAAVPLRADDVSGFEKILLPVVARDSIAGAGGQFRTLVHAYSPRPCRVLGAYFSGSVYPSGELMHGPGTLTVDLPDKSRAYGRFIYVERACADQVSIGLVVYSNAGPVAIPVARERDWRRGETQFLGAEFDFRNLTDPAARLKLRFFDADGTGSGEVVATAYVSVVNSGAPIHVKLDRRDGEDAGSPFYGELDIPYPCIRITHNQPDCLGFEIRVEVVPLSPGLRYWALLTSTDNTPTQHIFAPLPQP